MQDVEGMVMINENRKSLTGTLKLQDMVRSSLPSLPLFSILGWKERVLPKRTKICKINERMRMYKGKMLATKKLVIMHLATNYFQFSYILDHAEGISSEKESPTGNRMKKEAMDALTSIAITTAVAPSLTGK